MRTLLCMGLLAAVGCVDVPPLDDLFPIDCEVRDASEPCTYPPVDKDDWSDPANLAPRQMLTANILGGGTSPEELIISNAPDGEDTRYWGFFYSNGEVVDSATPTVVFQPTTVKPEAIYAEEGKVVVFGLDADGSGRRTMKVYEIDDQDSEATEQPLFDVQAQADGPDAVGVKLLAGKLQGEPAIVLQTAEGIEYALCESGSCDGADFQSANVSPGSELANPQIRYFGLLDMDPKRLDTADLLVVAGVGTQQMDANTPAGFTEMYFMNQGGGTSAATMDQGTMSDLRSGMVADVNRDDIPELIYGGTGQLDVTTLRVSLASLEVQDDVRYKWTFDSTTNPEPVLGIAEAADLVPAGNWLAFLTATAVWAVDGSDPAFQGGSPDMPSTVVPDPSAQLSADFSPVGTPIAIDSLANRLFVLEDNGNLRCFRIMDSALVEGC